MACVICKKLEAAWHDKILHLTVLNQQRDLAKLNGNLPQALVRALAFAKADVYDALRRLEQHQRSHVSAASAAS